MFVVKTKWHTKFIVIGFIIVFIFGSIGFTDLKQSVIEITDSAVEVDKELMIPFQEIITGKSSSTKDVKSSRSSLGVVDVLYNSTSSKKIKVLVTKGKDTYTYPMFKDDNYEKFPLPLGSGTYNVAIYQNISGTKYKKLKSTSVKASIYDDEAIYLNSIQTIGWTSEDAAVLFMEQLIEEHKATLATPENPIENIVLTKAEIIDLAYEWVVNNIYYDYAKIPTLKPDYVPNHVEILEVKKGICYDYSSLLGAMLRSQGVPVKLVKGYSAFTDVYHAWNEIYLTDEERWIVVDTTFDAYMAKAGLKYEMEKSRDDYSIKYEY